MNGLTPAKHRAPGEPDAYRLGNMTPPRGAHRALRGCERKYTLRPDTPIYDQLMKEVATGMYKWPRSNALATSAALAELQKLARED